DRPPGPSAVIAPEHAIPVGPTPRPSVNERVRSEASRTVADSLCRHGGTALNVNNDDLAVGGDQYRHDDDLLNDCRALGARKRAEPLIRGRRARVAHGRMRMIVFPLIRVVGLNAATASSRVETLPMFVRSRPSRTRWTIALSWARSDSTTKC